MAANSVWWKNLVLPFLVLLCEKRMVARIHRCFKQSKLTEQPTIDLFDFKHHPSRSKQKATILLFAFIVPKLGVQDKETVSFLYPMSNSVHGLATYRIFFFVTMW
ncbi:MAG: hypothetical protein CSA33_01710 [Desulfobulbus propionicus]|nr:MAG: hypothetical protein CSA33_01710 [Desulfobulbus propionicus]